MKKIFVSFLLAGSILNVAAQKNKKHAATYPDSIAPVGIIKNLPDTALLEIVQRQTFRYFWHFAHPVSGLSRERDNTVNGQYYWDWINEAYNQPNISNNTYGPEACAMAGTGMGIMATIVAVNHWSPNNDFDMNFPIKGWNEGLITYIMAAASPYHSIEPSVYFNGFVNSTNYKNDKIYYGIKLPLGFEYGGPLFISQYTFLGIDPHGLTDWHTNYLEQNTNHTLINRQWCIENPKHYKGYGENCWGLTAGDSYKGYVAHCPEEDFGVIQPTAALSAFPYTPQYSMQALKHFYYDLGDKIWSDYGFADGFSEEKNWYAKTHLAIDEGPIVVMIENYRTGLLWKLFMNIPDVQNGLKKLGFTSPYFKENK